MTMKTTTTKGKIQKILSKSARRKCRSYLNRRFLSENFIYDSLNVSPKSIGTIIDNVIKFQKEPKTQKYPKEKFFLKACGFEVILPIDRK